MTESPLKIVTRCAFDLSRVFQCLGSFVSLILNSVGTNYHAWFIGDKYYSWNLVGIPQDVAAWQWAAIAVSFASFVFRCIKTIIRYRYGAVHYILMYTKFNRDSLHATVTAIIDLLFCISFAVLAYFASQPVLGFTFLTDDCAADVTEFGAIAVNISSVYNSTQNVAPDPSDICIVFKVIPILFMFLAILSGTTAGLRPFLNNSQARSIFEPGTVVRRSRPFEIHGQGISGREGSGQAS